MTHHRGHPQAGPDEGDTDEPTMRAAEALGQLRTDAAERDRGQVLVQADRLTDLVEVAHRRLSILYDQLGPVLTEEGQPGSDPTETLHDPSLGSPLAQQLAHTAKNLEYLLERVERITLEVEL